MRALLTWLDVHGAAVQGAAAVVQAGAALVTVVLIRVTTKYVRLTEQLARAATDEEQYRQIAARGRRAELAGLLDRLRQSVGGDRSGADAAHAPAADPALADRASDEQGLRRRRFASILRRSRRHPRGVHVEHRSTLRLGPHGFAGCLERENRRAAEAGARRRRGFWSQRLRPPSKEA